MIQRIQSVYLLLTTLMAVLFLQGDLISFNNSAGESMSVGIGDSVYLTALLILIPVVALVTIFIYKNRKLQMRLTLLLITLIVVLILSLAYYYYQFSRGSDANLVIRLNLVYPLLMLMFSFLAYRGIRKDEELVRSYDRLR